MQIVNKVVFLDVDGVLNRSDKHGILTTLAAPGMQMPFVVDLNVVQVLNHVFKQVEGFRFVVSSTWRNHVDDVEHFCKLTQLNAELLHEDWRTKQSDTGHRQDEVCEWLSRHMEVVHFVVVDDEHPFTTVPFVQTNGQLGLSFTDLNKLLKVFGRRVSKDLVVTTLGGPLK